MDVTTRRGFWSSIREDAATGRTVIFATHYLEEADAYADRIVLLRHGHGRGRRKLGASSRRSRLVGPSEPWLPHADVADAHGIVRVSTRSSVRGDSVLVHGSDSDAVARHLLNRHRCARRRDHFTKPRGRVRRTDRRRRGRSSSMTATDAMPVSPTTSQPAPKPERNGAGRLLLDVRSARAAPHAPEPAHGDLHLGDADGLLPAVRHRPGLPRTDSAGNGNVTAYVLISMAVYGAMLATTSGGAIGVDRARRRMEPPASPHAVATRSRTSPSR